MQRKTKIICTLGPAVESDASIEALILAGMDVARINCSHGSPESHRSAFRQVRRIAESLGRYIPIMLDLQGPKIRIGNLEADIPLEQGQTLEIQTGDFLGNGQKVATTYTNIAKDVASGQKILLDDGKIILEVTEIVEERVICKVVIAGILRSRKGMNLPDTAISAPCISEKDKRDLKTAVEEGADFVAVSFVRSAEDISQVKRLARSLGADQIRIIAKIERPEALKNLLAIIKETDGVMVARGDLGVEIGSHRVPMIQKEIIHRSNMADKFVITATQMLDSMIERPVPTRAEASDVANAIIDGTDACMLSGETAAGDHPIETVKMMERIAMETESHPAYGYRPAPYMKGSVHRIPDGLSVAAYQTANLMGAKLLVAFTNSGGSALKLSKKHPDALVVGATVHEHVARRMQAYWGVFPIVLDRADNIEVMFYQVTRKIIEHELCEDGDLAIFTSGFPLWTTGSTNLMKITEIEFPKKRNR